MGTIAKIKYGDTTHLIASTAYGTCSTGAGTAAKVATIQDSAAFTLMTGETIYIKFTETNTASNPTLNVNSTGAKAIMRYGTTRPGTSVKTSWEAGAIISFTYDGTNWVMNDYHDRMVHQNAAITTAGAFNILGGLTKDSTAEEVGSVNKLSGLTYNPNTNQLDLTGTTPKIQLHRASGTAVTGTIQSETDYGLTLNGVASATGAAVYITGTAGGTGFTYNSRTVKPILRINGVTYSSSNIETATYFLTNTNEGGGSKGYYVYGNNIVYGHHYIGTIGKAGTATTYTNPEDETQTVTGYTGNTTGTCILELGNNKAVGTNGTDYSSPGTAGNANNARGYLRIYGAGTNYTDVLAQANGNRTLYLPNYNNTMYLVHAGNNSAIGSASQPVYVAANGRVTTTGKNLGYDVNAKVNSATQWGIAYYSTTTNLTSTAAGTSGYLLQGNGAAAPSWVQATNANTASTIVKRDASGNFSAGTITATLSGSASSLTTARAIDGVNFNGTAAITHYGTCGTAAGTAAKTVTLAGFTLATGAIAHVKFTNTNTAATPTLNINSTGAKNIYDMNGNQVKINGNTYISTLLANHVYTFLYDGTNYIIINSPRVIEQYEIRTSTTSLNKSAGYGGAGSTFHLICSGSTTEGKPTVTSTGSTSDANVLQMNWDNTGGYDSQIAVGTGGDNMWFRKVGGTWNEVATKADVNGIVAAADAMVFKGTLAGAATTTYTPAANRGDTYKVSTAGLINGITVEVGDILICTTDSTAAATSSNYTTVRNNWAIVQNNVDGAVFKSTNTFTDGQVLVADGTNGKIKTSGYTIAKSVPSDAVFTDTKVNVVARGTTKAYLLADTTAPTSTAAAHTAVAETGVYLDTTAGKLVSTLYSATGTTDATSSSAGTAVISGGLAVAKKAWIGSGLGASTNNNTSSHLIISSSDTGAGGNVALELWRGTNASWQFSNEGGNLHFRTNYTTAKQSTYSVDAINIAYNTGNTTFKGSVTASSFSGSGASLTSLNASNLGSGTVPIARIPTGTTSSTVALGNHTHNYAGSSSAGGAATNATTTADTTNALYVVGVASGATTTLKHDTNLLIKNNVLYPATNGTGSIGDTNNRFQTLLLTNQVAIKAHTAATMPSVVLQDENSKTYVQLAVITKGTTSVEGIGDLLVGNNVATGTAGNATGRIRMYGSAGDYAYTQYNSTTQSLDFMFA